MIKLGSNSIGKIYLGGNSIGKAYLGSNLVFQKGSSPTPSIQPVFYDRLVFDGTAYIVTDVIPPIDFSIRVSLGDETLKAAQRLFMCRAGESRQIGALLNSSTTSSYRYFSIYYGDSSYVAQSSTTTRLSYNNARFSFWMTCKKYGFGNESHSFTKGTDGPVGPLIFGQNPTPTGQPYTGSMGIVRVYNSDSQDATSAADLYNNYIPTYTFRPCEYNGEAGLWCVETSTFFGNTAGAGTLSVANDE